MNSQRDILLVPFPFSDQSGQKVRPVLVISNDEFNSKSEDIIVCAITSNIAKEIYSIQITSNELEQGKLFEKSQVKVENLLKLDKSLVIKKIGKLDKATFDEVLNILKKLFGVKD